MEAESKYEQVIALLKEMSRGEQGEVYEWLSEHITMWDYPRHYDREVRAGYYVDVMSDILGVDIMQPTRRHNYVWGRYVVIYQMCMDGVTQYDIGRWFSLDHCTVLHGRDMVRDVIISSRRHHSWEYEIYCEFIKRIKNGKD